MANEMNFAETVMLVDAAYLNRVCGDLKKHFSTVLGRELPKTDLPVLMECLALDAGLQFGENNIQVLLIYDKESENMSTCQPGDLRQELNNVAFKSHLGEFAFYSFEPSDMAGRDELFLESLRVVADAKDVKRLIAVPAEEEYGNEVPAILNKVDGKDGMTVFGMNPPTEAIAYQWEMLGFAVLQALGIKADEL